MNQERTGVIYRHFCTKSGKSYIGQTLQSPKDRWARHLYDAENGSPFAIHCAIRKYGEENFISRIVEDNIPESQLQERENHYIQLWNTITPNGYNMREDGTGGSLTDEVKQKISDSKKGQNLSDETKQKISKSMKGKNCGYLNGMFGKTLSDEHIEILRKTHKGKAKSKDHREKIGKANTGNVHSEETKKKISDSRKGKYGGEKNPFYGKKHSEESKQKAKETRSKNKRKIEEEQGQVIMEF